MMAYFELHHACVTFYFVGFFLNLSVREVKVSHMAMLYLSLKMKYDFIR